MSFQPFFSVSFLPPPPQSLQAKLSFSSKEIVALSCAWCKSSYHNKEACFNPQRIGEECSLGEKLLRDNSICRGVVPPFIFTIILIAVFMSRPPLSQQAFIRASLFHRRGL
jgi:hypothetical protein